MDLRTRVFAIAAAVGVVSAVQPARAAIPAWSHGLQIMSYPVGTCAQRAQAALQSVGFTITNHSNPDSEDEFYVAGRTGNHVGIVMCDRWTSGKTWIHIVVASGDTDDSGVPGGLRQRLQALMGTSAVAPVSKAAYRYHDDDSGYETEQDFFSGGIVTSPDGSKGTWANDASGNLELSWPNGWTNRYTGTLAHGVLHGMADGPGGEHHKITLTPL